MEDFIFENLDSSLRQRITKLTILHRELLSDMDDATKTSLLVSLRHLLGSKNIDESDSSAIYKMLKTSEKEILFHKERRSIITDVLICGMSIPSDLEELLEEEIEYCNNQIAQISKVVEDLKSNLAKFN